MNDLKRKLAFHWYNAIANYFLRYKIAFIKLMLWLSLEDLFLIIITIIIVSIIIIIIIYF